MECLVNEKNLVLVGIGGAGVNTVKRISNCSKIVVEVQDELTGTLDVAEIIPLNPEFSANTNGLSQDETTQITNAISNYSVVLLCVGLGGETGSHTAPIIADLAKKQGKLVIAVAYKPFRFEGRIRCERAENAIAEIKKYADCTIYISNDAILKSGPRTLSMAQAFAIPDSIITEIIDVISKNLSGITGATISNTDADSAKCPVCLSTVSPDSLMCPICGFDQLGYMAINKEEAEIWLNTIVLPARQKWETKKTIRDENIELIANELISRFSANKIVESVG